MSLFRGSTAVRAASLASLGVPSRNGARGALVRVDGDTARRHSVVWACLRLRADLMSTMPIDVFRRIAAEGIDVEVAKPGVLVEPAQHADGHPMDITEWMYSTQIDLDTYGNAFGLITARDGLGLPAQIAPVSAASVTVIVRKGVLEAYRIGSVEYQPRDVWHERQHTVSGLHVGLSPIAYAALSIGGYLSAQEFAQDWFSGGAVPAAILKNSKKTLGPGEADDIKERFREATSTGGTFVTGNDWEYSLVGTPAHQSQFIEQINASNSDIGRFLGVPGDLVDVAVQSGAITYASITQRNLQLLIMNLGPAVIRRERALGRLTAKPRFVKLNTDALLRMDPQTRAQVIGTQIDKRVLAPSEARALDNRPPFTPEQIAEFGVLFPGKPGTPVATGGS